MSRTKPEVAEALQKVACFSSKKVTPRCPSKGGGKGRAAVLVGSFSLKTASCRDKDFVPIGTTCPFSLSLH